MVDPRLRLRHLRCFLETARRGSLSAAAEAMNVSQPAASKTLKELEEILGVTLFDRARKRLSVTAAGRVFQRHVGNSLLELARAQDLVRDTPKEMQRLAVGALPTAATDLLPRAAIAFRASVPDCMLRVTSGPNWLLMSQLREGTLDLVVGRMASAKVMEGLTFRPLYAESIVAVVRADHPLLASADPMAELAAMPLVLPPPGAVIAPLVRRFLSQNGLDPHGHGIETVSLAFGRRFVQRTDAVWFISRGVVADELARGALAALDIGEALMGGPVGVSLREDGTARPEQEALFRMLEKVAADQNGRPI